jgi:hypothetical protein
VTATHDVPPPEIDGVVDPDRFKGRLVDLGDAAGGSAVSRGPWMRNAGVALIGTPTIMFCVLIYAAVREPVLLLDHWDFYLPWIGLPYAIGAALLWWDMKHRRAGKSG